jgi:hypothetical protein
LWTTPANAAKFHIIWSTVPISENHTLEMNTTVNWWAAHAIGTSMTATPGQQQTVSFTVSGATEYYVSMFAWDSMGNISPMSNMAKSTNDPFPGVGTTGSTGNNPNTDSDGNDVSFAVAVKPLIAFVCACMVFSL